MIIHYHRCRLASAALIITAALTACAAPEAEQLPAVSISGQSGVRMGQTLTLTATTIEGTDKDYAWASQDPAVATVTATGKQVTVTPVSPGETVITATGSDSGLVGEHNVVVIALDAPDVIVPDATDDTDIIQLDVGPDVAPDEGPDAAADA